MDGEVELGRRGEAAVNSDGIYREPKQKIRDKTNKIEKWQSDNERTTKYYTLKVLSKKWKYFRSSPPYFFSYKE